MTGYRVELFSSDPPVKPGKWLTELDGERCVVSDPKHALVFASLYEARVAADSYFDAHEGEIENYVIRVK